MMISSRVVTANILTENKSNARKHLIASPRNLDNLALRDAACGPRNPRQPSVKNAFSKGGERTH